jgi:hypothetical protein
LLLPLSSEGCVAGRDDHSGVLRGLLANDTEQAFLVETPRVRPQRLGGADERRMFRVGFGERIERGIGVDVIDHKDTASGQISPGTFELEHHVSVAVHAVVNEQIDTAEARQAAPAAGAGWCLLYTSTDR